MPETFRDFPVMQALILVQSHNPLPSGHERAEEGDIISLRRPLGSMRRAQTRRYLWLLIEGLAYNEMSILDRTNTEPLDDEPPTVAIQYDKRRYSIPLDRLKVVAPFLDLVRVRDTTDAYQPFLNIDEDTGEIFPSPRPPLSVHGLVYDKALQEFL